MARTETRGVWDTLLIVAVAALAVTFAHAQQAAAADDETEEGRIVELSAEDDAELDEAVEEPLSIDVQARRRYAPLFFEQEDQLVPMIVPVDDAVITPVSLPVY